MRTRLNTSFPTIRTEGALLPADLLQRIAAFDPDLGGLRPQDYGLPPNERVTEAINHAWKRMQGFWASVAKLLDGENPTPPTTSQTRERWLLPLFDQLGFGRLSTARAIEIDGKRYAISHGWQQVPLHLLAWETDLDHRAAGGSGPSPHALLQELLNRSPEYLWGVLSNGSKLRLLRDNARLTRQAYLEFDLEQMMRGEAYADFALLWLLLHASRLQGAPLSFSETGNEMMGSGDDENTHPSSPHPPTPSSPSPTDCWLEKWSQAAQNQGVRALDGLRSGVQKAISALGQGFLSHPSNAALRMALERGELDKQEFYRQLLRVVYRLLFVFVAEERDLLLLPASSQNGEEVERERYNRFYSFGRLRTLASRRSGTRHTDLWQAASLVLDKLGDPEGIGCPALALPALGGFLFSAQATAHLNGCALSNVHFLEAIRALSFTDDGQQRRAVDYKHLGSEELGSVYESLLELQPILNLSASTFELSAVAGSERKTTGSYYTRSDLVDALLDSALEPVVELRLERGDGGRRTEDGNETIARPRSSVSRPPSSASEREQALLSIRICDAACGSGHFLIAAAHRLAKRLAIVRSGEDSPSPRVYQAALRDVISHCIYGVDINPMSVELCKVSLWMEALQPGKPLSFLDHHIQCGNSLIGAPLPFQGDSQDNEMMGSGDDEQPTHHLITPSSHHKNIASTASLRTLTEVPDEAFTPIEGDDKKYCSEWKKQNKKQRPDQNMLFSMDLKEPWEHLGNLAASMSQLDAMAEDSAADVSRKVSRYAEMVRGSDYLNARLLADAWCAAFVWVKRPETGDGGRGTATSPSAVSGPPSPPSGFAYPITTQILRDIERNPHSIAPWMRAEIVRLAEQYQFFHWHLAFPEVFPVGGGDGGRAASAERIPSTVSGPPSPVASVGFDVMLGNPPWEHVELKEREWFASRHEGIAGADTGDKRKKMIQRLAETDPALFKAYQQELRHHEGLSHFIGNSGVFPLTARGRINTYAIFAELNRNLLNGRGRAGIIVPTGIATDDTTKVFFGDVVQRQALAGLLDFENREGLFPAVDSRYKFCLFTLSGAPVQQAEFVFFAAQVEDTRDAARRFSLAPQEIGLFNPNTRTMPIFRTRTDAELTRKIYQRVPVLISESTEDGNPWGITFKQGLFNMTSDSGLFNCDPSCEDCLPLYEGKMIGMYDHRASSVVVNENNLSRQGQSDSTTLAQYEDPSFLLAPRYWVRPKDVQERLGEYDRNWLTAFKDITSPTNERTVIFTIIPRYGVGHTAPVIVFGNQIKATSIVEFIGNCNCLIGDYLARQKVGGLHLTYGYLKQFPILPPTHYTPHDLDYIVPRVVELTYTAHDLRLFAEDVLAEVGEAHWRAWFGARASGDAAALLAPFPWDPARRAHLRAELDAYYARLYGLTRDELRYVLDPQDVLGPDFPGETFRVLKEREMREYGEYRTRRLVLEKWDEMEGTSVNPPPLGRG